MAYDFTRSVSDPRDLYPSGARANPNTTAGAIGAGLSGLADVFEVGLKYVEKNRTNKALGELENALDPYVQAVGQGRMKTDEAFARTSAILKSHIDKYPSLADDFRQRAQNIWGVNPSEGLVKSAMDKENIEKKRQQDVDNYNLTVANQFGAIPLQEGTTEPDYEAGILVGRELSGYMANVEAASKEADLEIKRRRLNGEADPLSLTDQQKVREIKVSEAIRPIIQTNINTHIRNVPSLLKQLENPADAQSLAVGQRMVQQSYTTTREAIIRILNNEKDMDSTTYNNILGMVDSAYASYRNRTPDTISSAKGIVEYRGASAQNRAYDYIPDVMDQISIGGQAAATSIWNSIILAPTKQGADVRSDQQRRMYDYLQGVKRVQGGSPPPSDPGNPQATADLANGVKASVDAKARDPDNIPEQGLSAFGNELSFVMDKALETNDPDDYIAATTSVNSAGTARALERVKQADPEVYENTVQKIIETNIKSILALGRQSAETRTAVGGSILDQIVNSAPYSEGPGLTTPPSLPTATMGVVYNAETGLIEIEGQKAGVKVPTTISRLQSSINSSLKTIVKYKEHTPDNTSGMTDQELKLNVVQMSGIKVKGKTPEQQQEDEQEPDTLPHRAEGGPVEEEKKYIVGEEGLEIFVPKDKKKPIQIIGQDGEETFKAPVSGHIVPAKKVAKFLASEDIELTPARVMQMNYLNRQLNNLEMREVMKVRGTKTLGDVNKLGGSATIGQAMVWKTGVGKQLNDYAKTEEGKKWIAENINKDVRIWNMTDEQMKHADEEPYDSYLARRYPVDIDALKNAGLQKAISGIAKKYVPLDDDGNPIDNTGSSSDQDGPQFDVDSYLGNMG